MESNFVPYSTKIANKSLYIYFIHRVNVYQNHATKSIKIGRKMVQFLNLHLLSHAQY